MIILTCLVLGLILRAGAGENVRTLETVKLRGEAWLVILLLMQVAVPGLNVSGVASRVVYFVWLTTFPALIAISWANRRYPGMALMGLGLCLNLTVVLPNGGMPVFAEAASIAKSSAAAMRIPSSDFVHVVGGAATRAPWLADVIPLPGPSWLRAVASPGDILLFVGIVAFLAGSRALHSRNSP